MPDPKVQDFSFEHMVLKYGRMLARFHFETVAMQTKVRNRSPRDGWFHGVEDGLDVVVALQALNQRFHLFCLFLVQSLGGGWHPFKARFHNFVAFRFEFGLQPAKGLKGC